MNALFSRRYIPVICYAASEQYSSFLSLSLSLLSLCLSLFSAILPLDPPSWSSAVHSGKQGSTSVPRWFSVHTRIPTRVVLRVSPDPLVARRWLRSYMPGRLATRSCPRLPRRHRRRRRYVYRV